MVVNQINNMGIYVNNKMYYSHKEASKELCEHEKIQVVNYMKDVCASMIDSVNATLKLISSANKHCLFDMPQKERDEFEKVYKSTSLEAMHNRDQFMADELTKVCNKSTADYIIILVGANHFNISEILRVRGMEVEEVYVLKGPLSMVESGDVCLSETWAKDEIRYKLCGEDYKFKGTFIHLYENTSLDSFDAIKDLIPYEHADL